MNLFLRLLAVLLLVPLVGEARLVSMKADNVAVELPREWKYELAPKLKADWGKVALSAKGADGQFVLLAVRAMPGLDPAQAQGHFELLQAPGLQQGWKVSPMRETSIDGMQFHSFTLTRKGQEEPDLLLAVTFTKDSAYTLQLGRPNGNVNDAPVLEDILRSFRLLTPKAALELQILEPAEVSKQEPPKVPLKYVIAAVVTVVAVIGVVQTVLALRSKARRRRRRERRRGQREGLATEPQD